MKMKIARGLLYAGVIGLAIVCIIAIIDNYELAVTQGITSTISCYNTDSFDTDTGNIRPTKQCDQYNPQVVFFGSILLLCIDAFMFHFFNNYITSNAQTIRAFERDLKNKNLNKEGLGGGTTNNTNGQIHENDKKLFI